MSIRPTTAGDEQFVAELFLHGRPELAGLPAPLVDLQRAAQRRQYDHDFPGNVDQIVELDGPVGRCWTWTGPDEHRLLDLIVSTGFRGRGIGRSVLATLAASASQAGVPLRLSVWSANEAAVRLYRATGFEQYDEQNGYLSMQLRATP